MVDLSKDEQVILRNLQSQSSPRATPGRRPSVDQRRRVIARASTPLGREFLRRVPRLGAQIADLHAQAWVKRYFEARDAVAWIDVGIGTFEWELAEQLRSAGITPELAQTVIRHDTMIDRVRAGMPVWRIADLLRREGHLRSRETA